MRAIANCINLISVGIVILLVCWNIFENIYLVDKEILVDPRSQFVRNEKTFLKRCWGTPASRREFETRWIFIEIFTDYVKHNVWRFNENCFDEYFVNFHRELWKWEYKIENLPNILFSRFKATFQYPLGDRCQVSLINIQK